MISSQRGGEKRQAGRSRPEIPVRLCSAIFLTKRRGQKHD
nr:MAG TPA: hypothetical protein [Caudoviricetes sp.]